MSFSKRLALVICCCVGSNVFSGVIDIEELSLFNYSESIGSVLEHDEIGYDYSDFSGEGLDVVFNNNLDGSNFGTASWRVTNNGLDSVLGLITSIYVDSEIDENLNSFANETATYLGETTATHWEIDEPGYTSGDHIYNMLDYGFGDDTNSLGGVEDDVSFSLTFYLEKLEVGEYFDLTFEISEEDIGGIYHYDVDSDYGYFFNGFITYVTNSVVGHPDPNDPIVVAVPEPSSIALLILGLMGLIFSRSKTQ